VVQHTAHNRRKLQISQARRDVVCANLFKLALVYVRCGWLGLRWGLPTLRALSGAGHKVGRAKAAGAVAMATAAL